MYFLKQLLSTFYLDRSRYKMSEKMWCAHQSQPSGWIKSNRAPGAPACQEEAQMDHAPDAESPAWPGRLADLSFAGERRARRVPETLCLAQEREQPARQR